MKADYRAGAIERNINQESLTLNAAQIKWIGGENQLANEALTRNLARNPTAFNWLPPRINFLFLNLAPLLNQSKYAFFIFSRA